MFKSAHLAKSRLHHASAASSPAAPLFLLSFFLFFFSPAAFSAENSNSQSVLAYEYAWMHGCTRKLGMKICGKFGQIHQIHPLR